MLSLETESSGGEEPLVSPLASTPFLWLNLNRGLHLGVNEIADSYQWLVVSSIPTIHRIATHCNTVPHISTHYATRFLTSNYVNTCERPHISNAGEA